MRSTKKVKEAYVFLGLTLAFSYFVFWVPLALFKIPTSSFVNDVKGPPWTIALFLVGGFVPSLLAIFLIWKKELDFRISSDNPIKKGGIKAYGNPPSRM